MSDLKPYPKSQQIGTTSKANTYLCSDGSRVTQAEIDSRLKRARQLKGKKLGCAAYGDSYNLDEHGPIDCDHTISQARCKTLGKSELIWDLKNIEHSSRVAHSEWESYRSGYFETHLNVVRRMRYVKLHDLEGFEKRMAYMNDHIVMTQLT